MMPRLSLTVRTFLFSAVPVCAVLLLLFAAVNAAVHRQIRRELREQLAFSDFLLNRADARYTSRITPLVSKLTDSAGLKAAVSLLNEVHGDPGLIKQVRTTINVQLRDLLSSSGFDFLAVTDAQGHPISTVPCSDCAEAPTFRAVSIDSGLAEIGGQLYQLHSVPIVIDGDEVAVLVLGYRFELTALSLPGEAVLLGQGKVIASTLPAKWKSSIEREIASRCPVGQNNCEASFGGEAFVVSPLQKLQIGTHYRLLGFQSLDRPVEEFTSSFLGLLIGIGAAGICLVLAFTFVTSHSVSRPLRALVAQLRHSELSGGMSGHLTAGNGVRELASLAEAYNRVADSEHLTRQQLEEARDAAQLANRLKDEFLTNVSHELRTPLNGVLGMTDLLLYTPLDNEQQEFVLTARGSAETLLSLIDNVLNFSQLQTGKASLHNTALDLAKLVEESAQAILREANAKGIAVSVHYPPNMPNGVTPSRVIGDEIRIRQILEQLCGNAVKFTDRGSIGIRLECRQEAARAKVKITVEDTGIGIAADQQNMIFTLFTQADGSMTRQRGGTGLGLALVKDLVALMNGQVGVDSRLGQGSAFWVALDLPVVGTETPAEIPPHRSLQPAFGGVPC